MKYLNSLLVLVSMLLPTAVWAQAANPVKKYLNLYYKNSQLFVGLYKKDCVAGSSSEDEGTCVRSYEITSEQTVRSAFINATTNQWVSGTANATMMQSNTLNLATDIDFGYTFENGKCSDNFVYLFFSGSVFDGQDHTISNLCSIDDGQTKQNLGLFGQITEKTVKNLNISNVHFVVTSGEPALTSGGDYRPVGALAPKISNSIVKDVKLKNVVIQAPLAGGLAGYIENSTIKNISTIDNSFIKISNKSQITDGYIGSVISGDYTNVFKPYKVLLGGLAGAAFFTNFVNVDLAVQVENKAAVDMSALGGLVGHYVYAPKEQVSDQNSKITKVNIHGSSGDVGVNALISGGTAMGGILGAARRLDENNSPVTELSISKSIVTNLDIKQSKFKISDADAKQKLYFGGIIGNSDLCSGGILKISESDVVGANIEETILENGNFQYYMGGIAGYASCYHLNNSGNRNDLYLTIQNSTASGSITLNGGYTKTGKKTSIVRTSAVMGGLVGDAILSLEEDGITENKSYVSIAYKAKRSASDDLDSVLVGGIFGAVSFFNSSKDSVRLTNLFYEGLIDIDDDGISTRVGGIVGRFPLLQSGDPKIEFSNVHVKGNSKNKIVSYSGESIASSLLSSSIGGICGVCLSPKEISKSSVQGDFESSSGNEAPPKKAFHVGGLVGTAVVAAGPMVIKNNYFIGSIENKFNKDEGAGRVGYLFGFLTGDGLGTPPQITSNFHYGDDNASAIGYFANYGEYRNITYFNESGINDELNNKFIAKNNVRNGKTINLQDGENGSVNNGTVTEAYMKNENFAGFLNTPWDDVADLVWSSDDTHDKLPYFGDTPASSTVNVVFKDESNSKNQDVKIGDKAIAPVVKPNSEGQCFIGWDPANIMHVMMPTTFKAQYGDCNYTVTFYDLNGDPFATDIVNKHGGAANKPATNPSSTEDGLCFVDWKDDFSNVIGPMDVSAISKICEYTVTFTYTKKDGTTGKKTETVEYNKSATPPSSEDVPQKTDDGQCFVEWDVTKDFAHVKGDLTVAAQYETCKYTVKFFVINDKGVSELLGEDVVEHGKSATAPKAPEKMGGLCFDSWAPGFSNVTNKLDVTAQYKTCASSSSSSQQQSGSSSSSATSGSSADQSSSSGTLTPNSSSSVNNIFAVTKPTAKQDGSALRMTINDTLPDSHAKVDYHIVVKSDVGTYLDTVVDGKTVGDVKNGTWSLDPAPAGEYKVLITLTDGKDSIVAYDSIFVGSTEKRVDLVSNTWQTYSLYAFCNDKGENCKNDLKDRFARKAEIRAIEECRQMKEDLARSPDDADLRESVEEVCREAIESQNEVATSVFWWDESSPIGDYWQYRRYDADDKFDSTRGYWYGSVDDEPLMLSLQTPNMKDEIVWKLENKYTGWNLVANPYGWYVKLPQNDDVVFKKWKADISDYDTVSILGPYEAVWAYTSKTREYRIPLKAAIVLEGEKKAKPLSKSATSESWNLRVVLTDKNGKRDYWNELAAGSVASSLSEPPAGMGDRVNLSIVEGKQHLAKSVKKNGDDLEWNLEASATTTRDGKLSFVGLESVWSKGLHVYATIGDETVEVVKDSPVNVKLSSKAKNVSIRVIKSAVPVQVARNLISGFRVNQMQNALNVGFDAASKLAGAKVKVSVVGVDGRVVATSKSVANEGSNAVSMKKPKQGLYFVRLKVGSQSAVTRIMVR